MSLSLALARSTRSSPVACSIISTGIPRQATTAASPPDGKMDKLKEPNPTEKTGRTVMAQSFGDGYSTRSDEEGFGGTVCSGNQAKNNIQADKEIHANHPAYDKTQGSHVNEKEHGRHQKKSS